MSTNTKLACLLYFNGTDEATSFTDDSINSLSISNASTPNAKLDTSVNKFGSASCEMTLGDSFSAQNFEHEGVVKETTTSYIYGAYVDVGTEIYNASMNQYSYVTQVYLDSITAGSPSSTAYMWRIRVSPSITGQGAGQQIYYSGTDVSIPNTGNALDLYGDFGVSMWIKKGNCAGTFFDMGLYRLTIESDETVKMKFASTTKLASTDTISSSDFTWVVFSRCGHELALYIDGIRQDTYTEHTIIDPTTFQLGNYYGGFGAGFAGWIDEVLIWNGISYANASFPKTIPVPTTEYVDGSDIIVADFNINAEVTATDIQVCGVSLETEVQATDIQVANLNIEVEYFIPDPVRMHNPMYRYELNNIVSGTPTDWVTMEHIDVNQNYQFQPSIISDSEGVLHAVCYGNGDGSSDRQIRYSQSTNGGNSWSNWVNIQTISGYNQYYPRIKVDSNDNLHVCWYGYDATSTSKYQIKYSSSTDGGNTWSNWVNIQPISGYSQTYPKIEIDSNDDLHIVWFGTDASNSSYTQIKYSNSNDGGASWNSWVNLQTISGYAQRFPSIAIDSNDNLYVCWSGHDVTYTNRYQIKYSKSTNGGISWSSWVNIQPISNYDQYEPYLEIDSSDNVHVVWWGRDSVNTINYQIKYSKSTDGGSSWGGWINIDAISPEDQRIPFITSDSSNNLYVTCSAYDTSTQIKYSKSTDGGSTWTNWAYIYDTSTYDTCVSGSVVVNGFLHVIWYGWDSVFPSAIDAQIKYSRLNISTDEWTIWVNIPPSDDYDRLKSKIAIDSNNNMHVVWYAKDDFYQSHYQIRYSKSIDNGSTWSGYINISPIDGYNQQYPDIAIDSNNNIFVIWHGNDSTTSTDNIKFSKSTDGGNTWSSWINIQTINSYNQRYASITIDSSNGIHVCWSGTDATYSSNEQIKYSGSINGGTTWSSWTNIQPISGYSQLTENSLCIATDFNNYIHVCWGGTDAINTSENQIKYSKSTDGGSSWSSWINIQTISSHNQIEPCIAIDSDDYIYIAWSGKDDDDATYYHIKFSKSTDGGSSWSSWANIESSLYYSKNPQLRIDSNNVLHVIYDGHEDGYHDSYSVENIKYSVSSNGSTWSNPVEFLEVGFGDIFYSYSLSIDDFNVLHIITTKPDDADNFLKIKYSQIGATLSSAENNWVRVRKLRARQSSTWDNYKTSHRENDLWNRTSL